MSQHDEQDQPRNDDGGDDDGLDREAILARRRMLVTAALAGLAMQHCDGALNQLNPFRPCLEPAMNTTPESGPTITPHPCLQPRVVTPELDTDASSAGSTDASAPDGAAAGAEDAGSTSGDAGTVTDAQAGRRRRVGPRVVSPPVRPHVCLSPMRPCLDVYPHGSKRSSDDGDDS